MKTKKKTQTPLYSTFQPQKKNDKIYNILSVLYKSYHITPTPIEHKKETHARTTWKQSLVTLPQTEPKHRLHKPHYTRDLSASIFRYRLTITRVASARHSSPYYTFNPSSYQTRTSSPLVITAITDAVRIETQQKKNTTRFSVQRTALTV